MTSANDITKGADGVWRHASGRPVGYDTQKLMTQAETGRALTAAATSAWRTASSTWPKGSAGTPTSVAQLLKGWRAAAASRRLQAARAEVAVEALTAARRDLGWRASAARTSMAARNRKAGLRDHASWMPR